MYPGTYLNLALLCLVQYLAVSRSPTFIALKSKTQFVQLMNIKYKNVIFSGNDDHAVMTRKKGTHYTIHACVVLRGGAPN